MPGLDKIRPNNLLNFTANESSLTFGIDAESAGRLDFYPKRPLDGANYFVLEMQTSQPLKCSLLLNSENLVFFVSAGAEPDEFRMILADSAAKMAGRLALGILIEPLTGAAENWSAWVNEDGWGAGVRSPGITKHIIARFGAPFYDAEAYLADPTTYISPIGEIKIDRFQPLEYKYSLAAGTIEQMRELFRAL